MQKRKHLLKIFMLLWILIYFNQSNYCDARVKQGEPYREFERLIQNNEKVKALEIGHSLFESLVFKYPANASLQHLQRRLQVAYDLANLISKGLESGQKKSFDDVVNLDMLPELPLIGRKEESATIIAPAEQLYWTHVEFFSHEFTVQGVSATEREFLRKYYDLRMRSLIEKVVNITIQVGVINPESSGLSYYSLVLPLLYLSEKDHRWDNLDYLFAKIGQDKLDVVSDFCLLQVERPKAAMAIAKYKAKSEGRSFSVVNWSLAASAKCVENHRPDLAERILTSAIDGLDDKDKIVKLRLKIVESYGKCGDNATAAKKCGQIATDFRDSLLYGRVMNSYFAYLAKQSQAQKILLEINSALESPQCQGYLPQLMYLKWWALRKTEKFALAKEVGKRLIKDYGDNQCIAPVLLAHATDALSNQRYENCQILLTKLIRNFPQTNSAKQARKILGRLGNK